LVTSSPLSPLSPLRRRRRHGRDVLPGIQTHQGLVMRRTADQRRHDQVNVCRKMHLVFHDGERLHHPASGGLSITQSVTVKRRDFDQAGWPPPRRSTTPPASSRRADPPGRRAWTMRGKPRAMTRYQVQHQSTVVAYADAGGSELLPHLPPGQSPIQAIGKTPPYPDRREARPAHPRPGGVIPPHDRLEEAACSSR
jgi:hypothetical protein